MHTPDYPLLNSSFIAPPEAVVVPQPDWPEGLPGPGFIRPVPEYDDYAALEAMNTTTLLHGMESMEHLKAAIDGRMRKESSALDFGKAFHMRLLEPEVYHKTYVQQGTCSATVKSSGNPCTNDGIGLYAPGAKTMTDIITMRLQGQSAEWFCGVHGKGKPLVKPTHCVTQADGERLEAMSEKVKRHPVVKLLRQSGGCEETGIWDCEGVPFKFRLDKWAPNVVIRGRKVPTIVDLKKIRPGSASKDKFSRHIVDYSYHVRAWLQVAGVEAITGIRPAFVWVVVEDAYPYGINVLQADDDCLHVGRCEAMYLLDHYKRCLETGEWPGYSDGIGMVSLPEWELKKWGIKL